MMTPNATATSAQMSADSWRLADAEAALANSNNTTGATPGGVRDSPSSTVSARES